VTTAGAGIVAMATKWHMAKETAARVMADLDREVEDKCRRFSKTRDLSSIGFLTARPNMTALDTYALYKTADRRTQMA
jgi:hypothetical protein